MSELDALKLLRRIEEGVAGKTGEAFFQQIVLELSRALNAHGAFTSRLLPGRRARMLAFWVAGRYETCHDYVLEGTPCDFVYRGEITAHARDVGNVFPADRAWFEELGGVQSYLGIPIKDETGNVCGHLAVVDTRERDWAEADVDVLRLFSLRSAAEINRTRYQSELEEANGALRAANEQLATEIANRAAAEAQLAAAKAAAERANQAKSVFISQMSHELRTPLNGILGFAQLLKRQEAATPERIREGLSIIERSGEHLLKLVNDLLDLARIEADKLELSLGTVDLLEVLEDVASLARVRAADAGLTFEATIRHESFAPVVADERVIRQVLLNLLGNATKFTDPGGRVRLRAEGMRIADNRQFARFVVEDTGIGIDDAQLARIFEPFHRVITSQRTVEGTGLGLTITQRLVAALNGRLAVSSRKGEGSTFTIECEFDLAAPSQGIVFSAAEIEGYTGESRTIFVADDDPDNRALMTGVLESVGFRVLAVGNGREALDRMDATRPDLILTDLVMPVLDGMELVREVRAGTLVPHVPVIAMSASASDYTREEALQAGCSAFVPKPLKLAQLLETIGEQLRLQWCYRSAERKSVVGDEVGKTAPAFRLSPRLAAELQDLAMKGDIMALMTLIDSALANDSAAKSFCHEVRQLASQYDIRGIRRTLAASCRYGGSPPRVI